MICSNIIKHVLTTVLMKHTEDEVGAAWPWQVVQVVQQPATAANDSKRSGYIAMLIASHVAKCRNSSTHIST